MPGKVSLERYAKHDFRAFIPPRHGGDPNTGKGNGRITDDTLMTEVLIKAYGDALKTLRAGVCYGRDCDSIAGMALGMYGALFGVKAIPQCLRGGVDAANRRDFRAAGAAFMKTIAQIAADDRKRWRRRTTARKSR